MSTDLVAGERPGDDLSGPARPEPAPPGIDGLDDRAAREALERSAARLALVHEIDRAILAAESTTEIAERVVERLRGLACADRVAVATFDMERRVATVLAFSQAGLAEGYQPGAEVPVDGAVDPRLLEHRETVVHRDLAAVAATLPGVRTALRLGYRAAVTVPLVADDRLVGMLAITGRDEGVASDDNVAVATEVATQLAVAIQHAEARERLERSHARLSLVHQIDRAILAAATGREIAESVAEHLLPLLAAELVGIAAYQGSSREMLAIAGIDAERIREQMQAAGPGRPGPATLAPSRDVLVFDRLEDALEVMPSARISIDLGLTVGTIVPLVVDGRVVGTVALAGRDRRLISPETVAIAREVGDQLAIAIDQARRREVMERAARRQDLVHEIDQAILASESPEDLAARVAEPLLSLAGARRLDISAYDMTRNEGRILGFAHDGTPPATPVGTVFALRETVPMVATNRPSITVFDDLQRRAATVPLARNAAAAGLTHGAWIPMLTGGRLVGAVSLAGDDPAMLREETLSMAEAMGDQLAVALQHAADRAALEERESRLRAILEGSPNGILVVGADGLVQYANAAAHRLFGALDGTLAGARHDALVPDAVAPGHLAAITEWFGHTPAPQAHPVMSEARRLDGSTFPVHVLLARVESRNGPLAITTVVDVSERTTLEARLRQAERLQVLGEFAGVLAHDMRNFLTAISWSAELLASDLGPDDPRQQEVELIQRATQDASAMTRSVLEFARPTTDPRGTLDVAQHLEGARTILERIVGDPIRLEVEVDPGLPLAGINATALTQVLGNLAANARDAMPDGGTFRLVARQAVVAAGHGDPEGGALEPGRYVRLLASDTGTGMDETTRRRAFDPFFTTKTLSSAAHGTGLGLASVFMLVTRAGGGVRVESAPGRGTTFVIDLPTAG